MNSAEQVEEESSQADSPELVVLPKPSASRASRLLSGYNLQVLGFAALFVIYAHYFWARVSDYWFHPEWTTDDGLQQLFPFHKALHPDLFKNDLITQMIEGYLSPVHYWLSYATTWLCGDPIMMGHWVMLIQMVTTLAFMFMAVRVAAGTIPALFAITWLLHTRHIMQRLTAGLPRGWAAPVLTAYLYFVFKGNHRGVLLTILVGCLLHPPSTLVIAGSYGLILLWRSAQISTRPIYAPRLLNFILLSPLFMLITYWSIKRPPEIGTMVSYEEALAMPEFQKPKGRFPFVPLKESWEEIKLFGFQAFVTRFYNPGRFWKRNMPSVVMLSLAGIALLGAYRRRRAFPAEIATYLCAALAVYYASRLLAFKLYVPDRHLQFPLGIFWIAAFSIAAWRAFSLAPLGLEGKSAAPVNSFRETWLSTLALLGIGALVITGGGSGLNGAMNFNFSATKKGYVWNWMKTATPEDALIAGHPTHLDGVFLFAARQGFVTTETAHPFYPVYNLEMRRRLEISLRAHYAKDYQELLQILEPHGIDYFVFNRREFYPKALEEATYFPPLDTLVEGLARRPIDQFVFRQLPAKVDLVRFPFMPFRDSWSAVVDLKKLRDYLQHKQPEPISRN